MGQQSLVACCVIQTIQMERLNNGSKQMTCSCIRLMNWLPCSGPASYSALEKLKMKLKFFANLTSFPPSPMHPATTRCTRLCCAASALPHQSGVFSVTPPTIGSIPPASTSPLHTHGLTPALCFVHIGLCPQRSVG